MRNSQISNIHIPVIVLICAFVTIIFSTTILSNGYSKTPALDFEEHTDIQEHQTAMEHLSKNTNDMTTAMTMITTEQIDISKFDNTIIEELCVYFVECDVTQPTNVPFWSCNCEQHCEAYNNCCVGHNKTQQNIAKSQYECIRVRTESKYIRGFFAIAVCPGDYDNEIIKEKCLQDNIREHGPSVVHNNTMVFKNKYCALCHHIIDFIPFDVQFQDVEMNEEEFDNFSNLTRFQKLGFMFKYAQYELIPPAGTKLVSCVSTKPENRYVIYCKLLMHPVFVYYELDLRIYRNYDCLSPEERRFLILCHEKSMQWHEVSSIQALSVIFSFRDTTSEDIDTVKCQGWTEEVNDNAMCSGLETYKNFLINLEYYMISSVNLTFMEFSRICMISIWGDVITTFTDFTYVFVEGISENSTIAKVRVTIVVLKKIFKTEMNPIKQMFYDRKMMITVKDDVTKEIIYAKRIRELPPDLKNNSAKYYNAVNHRPTLHLDTSRHDIQYHLSSIQVNISTKTTKTFCSDVTIEVSKMVDDTLFVQSTNCNDNIAMTTNSSGSVLPVLTYLCFSTSIVALIGLLIYNRKHKINLNIPGSNLENLSISLLLTNVLFMFGIGASSVWKVCYIIGVVLHYLWLSVFSFMTISVVYIMSSLLQMMSRGTQQEEDIARRRRVITVIGLLLPILFVGPAVGIDQLGPDYLSSGYGKSVCFPNKYPANVIFFSGPVIFSLLINLICLAQIIHIICKIRNEVRHVRKSSHYDDAKIYLRIVVISGMFWIIGILGSITESDLLDYIFTILCGLQGLCITVANLTTTRVKCGKKTDDFSDQTCNTKSK